MRYGIIENGVVVNAVVADAEFATANGLIALDDQAGPGWKYDGSTFTEPDPVPIQEATPIPTKEQLMAQLQALQAQIQALG